MYLVVHLSTGRVLKSYNAAGWARRHINKLVDMDWKQSFKSSGIMGQPLHCWYTYETLAVMTAEEYNTRREEIDPLVEVKNMMSGKPVMIRRSEVGTCVDPSTETYWSM